MKDKKIEGILSNSEDAIKGISEQLADEFLKSKEETPTREMVGFDQFKIVYEEVESTIEPEEKEPDLIEDLSDRITKELNIETQNLIEEMSKSISDEMLTEMALELFADDPEIDQQEVIETVEEQIKNPERLVLEEEVVQQMEEGAMKSYLETMSKMKPVPVSEKTDLMGGAGDPVTQAQLNAATSQMMSKLQTALGSLGGGGLGEGDISKMINIEIGKLDSELTGNIGNLDSDLSSSLDSLNFILNINIDKLDSDINDRFINLTTDSVTEGVENLYYTKERVDSDFDVRFLTKNTDSLAEGGTNLYYQDDRVQLLVDSDYVMQRVSIETTLRFKGAVSVDTDTAPASPENGDIYINDSDAVAGASWTGISGVTVKEAFALGWAEDAGRWYVIGDANIDVDQMKKEAAAMATPVGTMNMWMGSTAPAGYMLCRGGSFDTNIYPELHAYLQANLYGYSSGRLPDYRGYFPGGHGSGGMHSSRGGKNSPTTGDPGVTISGGSHTHSASTTISSDTSGDVTTKSAGGHSHDFKPRKGKGADKISGANVVRPNSESNGSVETYSSSASNNPIQSVGGHTHNLDLSSMTFSGSTTIQSATPSMTLSGWDTRTKPAAFAINFIIRHDY